MKPVSLTPGTKLQVAEYLNLKAFSGYEYSPGMVLELLELTIEAPYGYRSNLGNWIVKCPFQTSVWSSIWICVDQGWLKVIPPR